MPPGSPPPITKHAKHNKKGGVKIETEALKQNIEQIAQRRKNNQRNGLNMPQVRGMQRDRKPQIQAEGDQDRCTHALSATRIARETQEPPTRPKQAKHNKKGNVNIMSETSKINRANSTEEKEQPAQRFQYASGAWHAERKKGKHRQREIMTGALTP